MKKRIAMLLALALCIMGMAMAEAVVARTINCAIEGGKYLIRMPLMEGEEGWVASDMAQDDSVVILENAGIEDGCFVARYAPTGDGEVSVGIRHFDGIACDAVMTWDLIVKDGAVTECTGGSHAESPKEDELDPVLGGSWVEAENGTGEMFIEKNPDKGWNVQILTPGEGGAVEFDATVFYDCELNALVYADGRFTRVPVTDDDAPAAGEMISDGNTGSFTLVGDDENDIRLEWYSSLSPEESIGFVRAADSIDQT